MQGSMKWVVASLAALLTVALIGVLAGTSQAASAGCSDMRWLTKMSPAMNRATSAFEVASAGDLYAGESKLRSARVYAYRAGLPCNTLLKGAQRNWLKGVNLALLGFDQAQDGRWSAGISSMRNGASYIRTATDYLEAYNS